MTPAPDRAPATLADPRRCPAPDALDRFALGRCEPGEAETVERHLGACDACSTWVRDAREDEVLCRELREVAAAEDGDALALAGPLHHAPEGYELARRLGSGSVGVVYEARQLDPARPVALKLFLPLGESPNALERFRREAGLLARLNHPGVAQIFASGTADTARGPAPFIAMELIAGEPITSFAEARSLSPHDRLALLARVADAVHHAHERGVLHRDLKPANILVTESGQPKVLDLGVARLIADDGRPLSLLTSTGGLLGTPAYMSPEQVRGEPLDARSDIYSLGVIAFELLAGRTPHEPERRSIPGLLDAIAHRPAPTLGSLDPALRGDVDAVVGRCLETEPGRRYSSARGLADDLGRLLRDEPVSARRPGALERLRRAARSHRPLVVAASVALLSLLIAIVLVSGMATQAFQAAKRAERASSESARLASFLERTLIAPVGSERSGGLELGEILDATAQRVDVELGGAPALEARVRRSLGDAYARLNRYDESAAQLRLAAQASRDAGRPRDADAHERALAQTLAWSGALDEARSIIDGVIARLRAEGDDPRALARALDVRASVHHGRCDVSGAIRDRSEALSLLAPAAQPGDPKTLELLGGLAFVLSDSGQHSRAVAAYRELLEAQLDADAGDRAVAWTLYCLGYDLTRLGELDEAERSLERALELQRGALGDRHVEIAHTLAALGDLAERRGDHQLAESMFLRSLEMRRGLLGEQHLHVATQRANLAAFYLRRSRLEEAVTEAARALTVRRAILGVDHRDVEAARSLLERIEAAESDAGAP